MWLVKLLVAVFLGLITAAVVIIINNAVRIRRIEQEQAEAERQFMREWGSWS